VFQVEDLNLVVEGLEKERDFYFGKLRDVEVLCQEHESDELPIVKQILDILYATEVRPTVSFPCLHQNFLCIMTLFWTEIQL